MTAQTPQNDLLPCEIWAKRLSDGQMVSHDPHGPADPDAVRYVRADTIPTFGGTSDSHILRDNASTTTMPIDIRGCKGASESSAERLGDLDKALELSSQSRPTPHKPDGDYYSSINFKMYEALTVDAGIFRHYAKLHKEKGTTEGDQKAFVNQRHADAIDVVLKEYEAIRAKGE